MAVRFIVDAHLPPALAKMLVDLGHEAQHVGRPERPNRHLKLPVPDARLLTMPHARCNP